jgi:hypothetical protein
MPGRCQEDTMSIIPIRLRDREILDAQLVRCRQIDNSFTQGAAAGLRWLTAGGPGPLTGTLETLIDFRSVVHVLAAAEDIIYGPPSSGRDYARGLEHALAVGGERHSGATCGRCRANESAGSRCTPIQP